MCKKAVALVFFLMFVLNPVMFLCMDSIAAISFLLYGSKQVIAYSIIS